MANNPKKMMDPTEAALSAIQEALNLRQDQTRPEDRLDGLTDSLASPEQASAHVAPAPPVLAEPVETAVAGPRDTPPQGLRAANDDQQSIGQILRALQRRPAGTSYLVAAIFSAVWVIGCIALSWAYLSDLDAALGPNHSRTAIVIGLGAAALLPIIFFFGVAHMAWRAQELRLIAQSMANVAMRLAEPEAAARDSIVTVGQAIRREVAAMGDGVERALARAGELEAMVQNEVAALERTYGDNEVRIRGLIQELAKQRDTLVAQAEQVRSAISNVHIDLTQDLSTISELVGRQVSEASQGITQSLAEKGEHITLTLGRVGDNMIQHLSDRGGDLIERLQTASDETSRAIATASDQLTTGLNFKTDHIHEEFSEIAAGLEDMMTARLDRITEGFSEKSLAILDTMTGRSQELTDTVTARAQELTDTIIDTSSRLAETIATRADEVNSTLKASGESLILDLNLRGGDVVTKLEQTGARITEAIVSRGTKVTDSFRESAERLVEVVAARGDAVKEMLSTRLASFEEMFNHSGAELGEKIARDSSTLGNLITRHLSEFDRTVRTYGSELVERLGTRTLEVSESMRSYVDTFDARVTSKAGEVTATLEQRLMSFQETLDSRSNEVSAALEQGLTGFQEAFDNRSRDISNTLERRLTGFQEALDSRTQTLTEALSGRVMDIAKTLAEGGKEVVTALDKRITDLTGVIDTRGAKLAETVSARIDNIDQALGARASEFASSLDSRIGVLEHLLVGRAETVAEQIEVRSRAAADLLNGRMEELSESIKTNSGDAARALTDLAVKTTEALGKSTTANLAATEAFNRSAAEATNALNQSAGALSATIGKSAAAASDTIGRATANAADLVGKNAIATREAIARSASEAEHTLSAASSEVNKALKHTIGNVERTLLGTSAEIERSLIGKADSINTAVSQRMEEMTRILDEKSGGLIEALSSKGQEFAGEVSRVTDQAVKAIETKSFVFTQTMMDNSEEIARLINEASQTATTAVTRTLGQLQEGAQGVTEAAKATIKRTLDDLHSGTKAAIEESKQTAAATIADMLETHGMLRSDTTALFERLREANILLQEVLSGAHDNMSAIEQTMVTRVSEFVAAMNELNSKSGITTAAVEQNIGTFNNVTAKVLNDLGEIATQFSAHGRSLAEAVELLDNSNRRAAETVGERQTSIEALVATLDARTNDFEERLRRFSGLLEESLDAATARAREIASLIAETSNESAHTIEQQFELVRTTSEEERKRTSETLNAVYDEAATQVHAMFTQSASRFTEIMQGMKQMAADMQQELETTRSELRRGILELPQETADTAAQMRRVIVDQIEALAELNRIVARHGRNLDAAEPVRREAEPALVGDGRTPARPPRGADITGAPPRRSEQRPALNPRPAGKDAGNGRNGGWLSELLTRASREEGPSIAPPGSRESVRGEERPQRQDGVDSLDSLAVDVARMIDHEAAADVWERYKRGERGVFTRRLYTAQGQKAFDEIRRKYRADPEFRQTVEQYIHEFERLLEDVSRGDRGPAVARNYLISDTGKVYTMLAHAAGRFDQ